MKVLSLFSGIGGLDLGLEGVEHVGFCEAEPFCQRLLGLRWPGVTPATICPIGRLNQAQTRQQVCASILYRRHNGYL